mmetsp:Transcript_21906/g.23872  ORF Transcript_21906/g.23872 Transcript_21906/m.23872 type:complete len:81 (+) Transcript_21906:133-375(+)
MEIEEASRRSFFQLLLSIIVGNRSFCMQLLFSTYISKLLNQPSFTIEIEDEVTQHLHHFQYRSPSLQTLNISDQLEQSSL